MFLPLLVATALVASVVSFESCPPQEDLTPCNCFSNSNAFFIDVSCKKRDFHDVQGPMEHLRSKKVANLWMKEVAVGKLPTLFFKGMSVNYLYFENCEMTELVDHPDGWAFDGLQNSLISLYLTDSIQGRMKGPPLSHMKHLAKLIITKSQIVDLNEEWTKGLPSSLREIWFEDNGITEVRDRALAGLANLEELIMKKQLFKRFNRKLLPTNANSLRVVDFSDGNLEDLNHDTFINMPALNRVDVSRNPLRRFDSNTWTPIWSQLGWFLASGTDMECDDGRINWMFKLKRPGNHMEGTCISPNERAGKQLKDVIDENLK